MLLVINIRQRKRLKAFGDPALLAHLMPDISHRRPTFKFILQVTPITICMFMIAGPQFGSKLEKSKRQGAELMIALDVSNSMMAEDIQPNRLAKAKQILSKLVDKLKDDKIGLIVFAGDAFTQLPITSDYVSAKMFLSAISPAIVPKQGTSLGSAINLGMKSFSPGEDKSKAMILITDGENHDDDPVAAATEAAKAGIVIHTIGIGTAGGVPVPVSSGGRKDYLKDIDGKTVISRIEEDVLRQVAVAGNGNYVRASNSNIGLDEIFSQIKKMKKQELESTMYTEYNDQFQIFAAI